MKISLIKTRAPFNALFSISSGVLGAIKEHMEAHGYDESHPIVLWDEAGVVVDGHTRLEAARQVGIEDVAVHCQSFADEGAALTYAIHNQRHRRNLTEAEILKCIEAVDARRDRGGDRRSEEAKSKPPIGGIEKNKSPSAQDTAHIVGVSTRKVERARGVLAEPRAAAAVMAGKKKISRAYQEIQAIRKSQNQLEPAKNQGGGRRAILQKALNEIQPWREKYKDYPELSTISIAIDACHLNLERGEMLTKTEGAPLPRKLEEPSPSSANAEDQDEKSASPDAGDKSPRIAPDEPDLSPPEIVKPQPKDQVAVVPIGSRNDGQNLVQCGNCDNFSASSGAPAGRGHCSLGEKSWNGLSTQFAVNRVHCSAFAG